MGLFTWNFCVTIFVSLNYGRQNSTSTFLFVVKSSTWVVYGVVTFFYILVLTPLFTLQFCNCTHYYIELESFKFCLSTTSIHQPLGLESIRSWSQGALKAAPSRVPPRPTRNAVWTGGSARTRQPQYANILNPVSANGLVDSVQTDVSWPVAETSSPSSPLYPGRGLVSLLPQFPQPT